MTTLHHSRLSLVLTERPAFKQRADDDFIDKQVREKKIEIRMKRLEEENGKVSSN